MAKNAVALGGGGAKGAYEVGVFEALSKLGFEYNIITGTSVGSINGAVIAQGDLSLARKMWKELTTNTVLDLKNEIPDSEPEAYKIMARELMENSGFDYTNLKALLSNIIDENKLRASNIDFGLVTVKFPSMLPRYLYKENIEKGKIVDYILASAACFPAMKPHKIGKELFIDGGYSDNLPINMAIKKGATTIVAVDLKSVGVIKKIRNKNVKMININSYSDLGNMLIFDKKRALKNMKLGYLDTFKAFGKADGFKYTFKKDELKANAEKIYPEITAFFKNYFKEDLKKYSGLIKHIAYHACKARLKNGEKLTREVYLSLMLESTMEFFDIPMYETYRVKKAEFIIKNKFKSIKKDGISSLTELIPNMSELKTENFEDIIFAVQSINIPEITLKIKELIKSTDNISIIKYICDLFDGDTTEKRRQIIMLLICAPMHFLSAAYIKTLLAQ